jgi:RNA polymerase sigma-70 factor (ECF subfamily)
MNGTMSLASVADADLVARCRQDDQEAWNEFVNRFSRYVYAIAVRIYGLEQHDAEDVFQEVFGRTYERLGDLREDAAVRAWIGTLTRRLCLDRLRGASREEPTEQPIDPERADNEFALLDEALVVREGLKALPERCGEILDRFFARDESYRMIGEALELPPGTIASRISRCLQKLRKQLEGRQSRFQRSSEGRERRPQPSSTW